MYIFIRLQGLSSTHELLRRRQRCRRQRSFAPHRRVGDATDPRVSLGCGRSCRFFKPVGGPCVRVSPAPPCGDRLKDFKSKHIVPPNDASEKPTVCL